MYLHITMIMTDNYGDPVSLKSAVKVTYFMCGNKKELFPVINQHWALKNQSQTSKVLMLK